MLVFAIVFTFLFSDSKADSKDLSVGDYGVPCIPTSVERGPCHTCVCSTSGVYVCRAYECDHESLGNSTNHNQECVPNYVYLHETHYCRCDKQGRWRSDSCREMFQFIVSHKNTKSLTLSDKDACKPSSLYLSDCNVCVCPQNGQINHTLCTQRSCVSGIKTDQCKFGQFLRNGSEFCSCVSLLSYYEDSYCIEVSKTKDVMEEIDKSKLETIIDGAKSLKELENSSNNCEKGKGYHVDCNKCSCDDGKVSCGTDMCSLSKTSLRSKTHTMRSPVTQNQKAGHTGRSKISSLEEIQEGMPCTVGKLYRKECNTCQCLKDNQLLCTHMACYSIPKGKIAYPYKHLPELPSGPCNPGFSYRKGCRLCYCDHLKQHWCSKKPCVEEDGTLFGRASGDSDDISKTLLNEIETEGLRVYSTAPETCTPGMTFKVSCNTCVCSAEGIITCQQNKCSEDNSRVPLSSRSTGAKPKLGDLPEIRSGEKCTEGNVYRLDCNTCQCIKHNQLICTKVGCLKEQENVPKDDLPDVPEGPCVPGRIYKKGCQICYCDNSKKPVCSKKKQCTEGTRSTIKRSRYEVMPLLNEKEFESLPRLHTSSADCEKGKTYRIDCNTCFCLDNGNLLCEKNMCLSVDDTNRIAAAKITGKACNTTYDSTCVDCTCENNQMKCEYLKDCFPKLATRQLHGLHQKLKPKMLLNLEKDKCLPKMVYRVDCNNCYCQSDYTLRCTKKGCLNNRQVAKLKEQRLKLLNSGL